MQAGTPSLVEQSVATKVSKANQGIVELWGKGIKNIFSGFGWIWEHVLLPFFSALAKVFQLILGFFRSAPGEYIIFIIFIIILLTGIMYLAFSPNSPFRRTGGGTSGGGGGGTGQPNYMDWVKNLMIKFNIDTSFFYTLSGTDANGINTTNRTVFNSGRCDSQNHLEYRTASGNEDTCLNTQLPKVIEWSIDPSVIPEWNSVPTMVKDKLLRNGKGTKIYIPWGVIENEPDPRNPFAKLMGATNTLTPLCSKAYFEDGSSAASLFSRENNAMCERAIIENTRFGATRSYAEEESAGNRRAVNRGESRECTLSDS